MADTQPRDASFMPPVQQQDQQPQSADISNLLNQILPKGVDVNALMKQKQQAQQNYANQLKQNMAPLQAMAMQKEAPPPAPPVLPPAPTQNFSDPMNAFKSIFPAIAMIGGLRTKHPAIAAAKSAAAAMNAYHKQDAEAIDLNIKNWKDSVDQILEQWKPQMEVYKQGKDNDKFDFSKMQALVDLKDKVAQAALNNGPEDTIKYYSDIANLGEKLSQIKKNLAAAQNQPTISQSAIDMRADLAASGDMTHAFSGLGRGAQVATNGDAIMQELKNRGMTGQQLADAEVAFSATKAGQTAASRTAATKATGIELAQNLLTNSLPILSDALEKVDNSKFKDLNSFKNYFKDHTNDPDLAALNEAIVNTESDLALLTRRGAAATVDSAQRAEKIINNVLNGEAFDAVSEQILKEAAAGKAAALQTRREAAQGPGSSPSVNWVMDEKGNLVKQ